MHSIEEQLFLWNVELKYATVNGHTLGKIARIKAQIIALESQLNTSKVKP